MLIRILRTKRYEGTESWMNVYSAEACGLICTCRQMLLDWSNDGVWCGRDIARMGRSVIHTILQFVNRKARIHLEDSAIFRKKICILILYLNIQCNVVDWILLAQTNLNHQTLHNRVGVSLPSHEDENSSSYRNVVFSSHLQFRILAKLNKSGECFTPSSEPFRFY
jgi:hypothetical protein